MGKEIIKPLAEMESAEGRNFGTFADLNKLNPRVFSRQIVAQTHSKFTKFLRYECICCKSTVESGKSVAIGDGRACADCFRNLSEIAAEALKIGGNHQRKTVRLYQCFGCGENFAARKMSNLMAVCRECFRTAQGSDEQTRKRFIEKTLNRIGAFLRRRI